MSAEVVLADGRIVTASATEEPDLFWAIRGGGGNFGVVTRFVFRARSLPNGVVAGTVDLDLEADLAAALTAWRDAMRAAPEQLAATYVGLPSFAEGIPAVSQIAFVWAGDDLATADAAIAPLLHIPGVTGHTIALKAYADVLMGHDEEPGEGDEASEGAPGGERPAMRILDENGFAGELSDALIAEVASVRRELAETIFQVRMLGGAYGRVAPDATAWGYRDSEALIASVAFVPTAIYDETAERVRATWSRLSPWLAGLYGNFSSLDSPVTEMYPPATLARLRAIKATYDPRNLFRRTHNITPA